MNLNTNLGNIVVSNDVVAQIAGFATTKCFGVKGMTTRSISDGLFHLLKRESQSKGVLVSESTQGGINIELHVACQYGVNIHEVCKSIISEVRYNVEQMTSIDVNNIEIYVETVKTDEVGGI